MIKAELLLSGKASFKLEVPYRLYQADEEKKKPLFIYLQEDGANLKSLEKKVERMLCLSGYHLLVQAPLPQLKSGTKNRGFYWIPDDLDDQSVAASREYVSEFLQEVIDGLIPHLKVSRLVMVGWEESAQQISYFSATRPHYVNEMILLGGSINRIWMSEDKKRYRHLRILGLTGRDAELNDQVVKKISEWINSEKSL